MAFRSEGDVDVWLHGRNAEKGAVVEMDRVLRLGHEWYAGRFDPDWERPGADDVVSIFSDLGLTGPFWSLE